MHCQYVLCFTFSASLVTSAVVICKAFSFQTQMFCVITGTSFDGADLKLAFAALTTVLLEAAKLDKDELSLRYCRVLALFEL